MHLWFLAFHIIFIIAFMAGLLIYPRLLVYRLEAEGDPRFEAAMDKAAKATRTIILIPTSILVLVFGAAMVGENWEGYSRQGWFWVKMVLVLGGLYGIHGYLISLGKKIARGERPITPKRLRMFNEIPMLIAVVVVILAVVKPF
jgi:putative membrane protein